MLVLQRDNVPAGAGEEVAVASSPYKPGTRIPCAAGQRITNDTRRGSERRGALFLINK